MKYVLITLISLFVVTGCASSNVSVTANIPESQEIDIRVTTKTKDSD